MSDILDPADSNSFAYLAAFRDALMIGINCDPKTKEHQCLI